MNLQNDLTRYAAVNGRFFLFSCWIDLTIKCKKKICAQFCFLPFTSSLALLRLSMLVFTSDGVVIGVIIGRVEPYDRVKIKPTESEAEY